MPWPAIIAAAATVATTAYSANRARSASSKASGAAAQGAAQEIAFARESRDQARQDFKPYREAGYTALNALHTLTGLDAPPSVRGAAQEGDEFLGSASGGGQDLSAPPQDPIASDDYVIRAFETYLGRQPTAYELNYYKGTRSSSGNPLRQRAGELYNDVIAPNKDRVEAEQAAARRAQAEEQGWTVGPGGELQRRATGGATPAAPAAPQQSPEDFLKADPGYQFRLDEGQRALETGASARGGFGDPHTRRTVAYQQGMASQEYTNVYNRISNIAGLGQVAAGYSANAASQFGAQAGQAASNAAYTRASGYVAQGNATQNTIGQIAQGVGYYFGNRNNPGGGLTANSPTDYGGYGIWNPGHGQ